MEGYLWKKGGVLSAMQRRYCVLKGTMLTYYTNEDECKRKTTPRAVLEVTHARDWDGVTTLKNYKNAFEIECLGGATLQCHSDSQEDKQLWMHAIQHALDEPNRIVQDEIDDAQQQLLQESEREQQALARAAEAVQEAQRLGQAAVGYEQFMKENIAERHQMEEKVRHLTILYQEAQKKSTETRQALEKARHRAHDAALSSTRDEEEEESDDDAEDRGHGRPQQLHSRRRSSSLTNELTDRIARLAAQLEVDTTLEETHKREIEALEQRITESSHQYAELFGKARECAEESKQLREAAASNLQQAQSAKQLSKLRIESWSSSSSHLDPLADGYLLCKHPYKPTMHRRYYVLFGNTLCWYKDADTFAALVDSPSGVVHVSGVADWTGKIGGMKVFPHAFSIVTVEGKVLCCSAPTRQSVTTWTTALHIGITMPPLSPHRAVAAKSRRDSFDLISSMAALSPTKSGHFQFPKSPSNSITESEASRDIEDSTTSPSKGKPSATRGEIEAQVAVEGYLVKKSAFVPVMKKKYCVLKGLRLFLFDTYEAYQGHDASHEEVQVCSVSDWDGHGALLHYNYGFQMQTLRHQAVFCSAANNEEKDKWVHGIRASLLKHKEKLLSPTRREDSMIDRARKSILRKATQQSESGIDVQEKLDEDAAASEEFRALLHEFYAEHNPSKLTDVPMLIDRYKQREKALVEHLDRIYGTELAQDGHITALLEKLASASKQHQLLRRKSSGVKSGLVEFVKMSGYLAWNNEKCYCILSVNKLVRYRNQTHYETEPFDPTESIVIMSVYEYPPPADFVGRSSSKNTFFVSYSNDDTSPSSSWDASAAANPQQQLALSATTVEEKLKWMAKIRSGLGFAHAERSKASFSEDTQKAKPSDREHANIDQLRTKLVEYYKRHNPRKVGEVETLLTYFAGKEKLLLLDLDATYGTAIATDPEFLAVVPHEEHGGTTTTATHGSSHGGGDSASYYESYLWVKHPLLGSAFQRCYCVLRDETWSCYVSSRQAHADGRGAGGHGGDDRDDKDDSGGETSQQNTPLLVDVVVNLHVLNETLQSMNVFSIETLANGPVLLRTDVEKLAQDWTHLLRRVVDKYRLEEQVKEREESAERRRRASSIAMPPGRGPTRQLYDLLVSFYQLHNPDKVGEVGTLLHAFKGRERKLLEEIDAIYHSKLSSDPTFLALLASVSEYQVEQTQQDDNAAAAAIHSCEGAEGSQILMEGYLVKRGHLIPSMRKRYCVLVKTTLEYYATHEDSRNPSIKPHGSFQVEIVSDWHGKTAAQVYQHGMELETSDGKTFFCSAYSADERDAWMHAFKRGLAMVRAEALQTKAVARGGGGDGDDADDDDDMGESESDRELRVTRRKQFKERLTEFYRDKNPKKLADLELLLTCYTRREFALLEAIDAAYGTALAHDDSLLALISPSNAHTRALATLQYDGTLLRSADHSWTRAQQKVHVAMNGLVLTFYASREGFKGGIATSSNQSVTVLAVKDVDDGCNNNASRSPAYRFAIETTDHVWIYFEAPNALEKKHWIQVLHAALDTILAQSLLEEELQTLHKGSWSSGGAAGGEGGGAGGGDATKRGGLLRRDSSFVGTEGWKGFLLVRLDFVSEADHVKKKDASVAMEERYFVLHHHNELVVYNDVQDAIVANFTVLSTRAWDPNGDPTNTTPITTKGDTKCRFPFQIVTQQQIVLSCSAATDLLRAKWIKQIRSGAERATALEMLQEQLHQAAEQEDQGQSGGDKEVIVAPSATRSKGLQSEEDDPSIVKKGYLDYKFADDAIVTSNSASGSAPREGFIVVTERAEMDVYVDEAGFYRNETPLFSGQACEVVEDPSIVPASSSSSSSALSSSSAKRHLQKLFGDDAITSNSSVNRSASSLSFVVQTKDKAIKFVHFFPASLLGYDTWMHAFRSGVDLLKGEELLADEKLILHLEEEAEEKARRDDSEEDGQEDLFDMGAMTVPGASMEGMLTPWRLTFSSPRPVCGNPVFYVLVGCRIRGFASRAEVASSTETDLHSETRRHGAAGGGSQGCLLDAEIASITDWDIPKATLEKKKLSKSSSPLGKSSDTESVGFQVEVAIPPSQSKETLFFSASSVEMKRRWVRVMKQELDFALAESYLDDDAREFARQVAAHMAAGDGNQNDAMDNRKTQEQKRLEGYVRVRHHFLGAIWRERFAVLQGTRLHLYTDTGAAVGDEHERKKALEKHDLIGVEKWHPTYSSSLGSSSGGGGGSGSSRYGFRMENEAGGYLECTVGTEDEQVRWMSAITDAVNAISSHLATKVMTRDAALPFIAGAAMEGYLKTKEKKKLSFFWKTRYCVVIGTQWLLYENQTQATAASEENGVSPVAVYGFVQVAPWEKSASSSSRSSSESGFLEDNDDELLARGFSVQVSSAGTMRIDCKAQSSLERKRWLNAMDDQLEKAAQESAHVVQAMQHQREKESAKAAIKSKYNQVQRDAKRQSARLQEALQLASLDDDDTSSGASESLEESEDGGEGKGEDADSNRVRHRSGSDFIDRSPESSPMRRKTAPSVPFPNTQEEDDDDDILKKEKDAHAPTSSFFSYSIAACFMRCFARADGSGSSRSSPFSAATAARTGRSIAPLGVPGFPANAEVWSRMYKCEYYNDDGYTSDSDW